MAEHIGLPDTAATRAFGHRLGEALRACDAHVLVGLSGNLGAGKTSLVGGVLSAFHVCGPIRSPTYTLIEPYELMKPDRHLFHLDLYRLRDPSELEELGVRELLARDNVLLVEWVENAPDLAAVCDLQLHLAYADVGRELSLEASSPTGAQIVATLSRQ